MRALLGSIVVLLYLGSQTFAQEPPKKDLPKPLSDDVVKAWTKAGAKYSWIKFEINNLPYEEVPEAGSIRTFTIESWKAGVIGKLPPPENHFGIAFMLTDITDEGLKELANLNNLTTLFLWEDRVTDAGLKELAPLKNLNSLFLLCKNVTDAELKALAPLKNLTTLSLYFTNVTDAGLKELAPLKNLTALSLRHTKVSDAGLKELTNLKKLTIIDLSGTPITDAGLKELANLKGLTSLRLRKTKVTDTGVAELQKALPKCKIEREP